MQATTNTPSSPQPHTLTYKSLHSNACTVCTVARFALLRFFSLPPSVLSGSSGAHRDTHSVTSGCSVATPTQRSVLDAGRQLAAVKGLAPALLQLLGGMLAGEGEWGRVHTALEVCFCLVCGLGVLYVVLHALALCGQPPVPCMCTSPHVDSLLDLMLLVVHACLPQMLQSMARAHRAAVATATSQDVAVLAQLLHSSTPDAPRFAAIKLLTALAKHKVPMWFVPLYFVPFMLCSVCFAFVFPPWYS